jgi:hypothetical protein
LSQQKGDARVAFKTSSSVALQFKHEMGVYLQATFLLAFLASFLARAQHVKFKKFLILLIIVTFFICVGAAEYNWQWYVNI